MRSRRLQVPTAALRGQGAAQKGELGFAREAVQLIEQRGFARDKNLVEALLNS